MARPTIKDVSRLAGVSIGTVSNVVNGHPNISPVTRQRVEDAIGKLGYKPNRAAKSLPKGRTGLLGYRMPGAGHLNPSMDIFLHQVVESAGSLGFEVLLFTPGPDQSELDAYTDVLNRGGVDAFLLAGIEYEDPRVQFLEQRGVPFSAFGRAGRHKRSVYVDVDGAAGIEKAVRHLIETGRERIAFLGWPAGSLTGDERFRGWREALIDAGLDPHDDLVMRSDDGYEEGRSVADQIVDRQFDAVVCVSDTFGLGVMAGLRQHGITPGLEVAVTGFDDVAASMLVEPGLTTVRQPMATVGGEMVTRLARILGGEDGDESGLLIEPELVIRGSSSARTRG